MKNTMPKSLVMPNCYLVTLVKSVKLLNITELIEFLKPWYGIFKYVQEIFYYLEKNCSLPNLEAPIPNLLSKAEQKALF